jgi:lipid A 4'-phosphatase
MASDQIAFKLGAVAALTGVAAAIVFVGWPDIDLAVARLFYVGPRHFLFNHETLPKMLRWSFGALTWGTAIAAVAGIILALARRRHLFGLGLRNGSSSRSCSSPALD